MRRLRSAALAAGIALAAVGCKEKAATPSDERAMQPVAAAKTEEGDSEYSVDWNAPDSLSLDEQGTLTATIRARKGFHVNAEYPHSFRADSTDGGVAFESAKIDLKPIATMRPCPDAADETCELSAKLPFKAIAKGEQRLTGLLAFSVCNPERCLIEKVPLSRPIVVR